MEKHVRFAYRRVLNNTGPLTLGRSSIPFTSSFRTQSRPFGMSDKKQEPRIVKISELSTEEAKWVEFKKIEVCPLPYRRRGQDSRITVGRSNRQEARMGGRSAQNPGFQGSRRRCHRTDSAASFEAAEHDDHPSIPTSCRGYVCGVSCGTD